MSPAENVAAIIKDKAEELMANEDRCDRYNYHALKTNLENTFQNLENDRSFQRPVMLDAEKI